VSLKHSLNCLIRKQKVEATEEEKVRQRLLHRMIQELGYPKSLIQVEKAISPLRRRFDIVVFYKVEDRLLPLLLVECKAEKIEPNSLRQLLGYNASIQAPFLGLADASCFSCFSADGTPVDVPSYVHLQELLGRIVN
jgi:hypothetical protein